MLLIQCEPLYHERVFGTLAQGTDFGGINIDMMQIQNLGDGKQQSRPVASDQIEGVEFAVCVGSEIDLGIDREVFEVTADPSALRGFKFGSRMQLLPEFMFDIAQKIAIRRGFVVTFVEYDETVECVAM